MISVKDFVITIRSITSLDDATVEKIIAICHEHKNLYSIGYTHGRTKRKELAAAGIIFQKWEGCPHITLTYTPYRKNPKILEIHCLATNDKTRTRGEYDLVISHWQSDVIDDIISAFPDLNM